MTFKETMAGIFDTAEGTYYKWKREKRPIIALLEKYFTKEDLEEFLLTNQVSKYESIERSIICDRLPEILKLLTKYTTKELRALLAKSFEENDVLSGTYTRLLKYSEYNKEDKFDTLKDIDYLLFDVFDEKQKNENDTPFQDILKSFNKFIGFDFNENDIPVIKQIMSRYKVYNTLHDLDKS